MGRLLQGTTANISQNFPHHRSTMRLYFGAVTWMPPQVKLLQGTTAKSLELSTSPFNHALIFWCRGLDTTGYYFKVLLQKSSELPLTPFNPALVFWCCDVDATTVISTSRYYCKNLQNFPYHRSTTSLCFGKLA